MKWVFNLINSRLYFEWRIKHYNSEQCKEAHLNFTHVCLLSERFFNGTFPRVFILTVMQFLPNYSAL